MNDSSLLEDHLRLNSLESINTSMKEKNSVVKLNCQSLNLDTLRFEQLLADLNIIPTLKYIHPCHI